MKHNFILKQRSKKKRLVILVNCLILLLIITIGRGQQASAYQNRVIPAQDERIDQAAYTSYLPTVKLNYPWHSPFGIESNKPWLDESNLIQRGVELEVGWTRIGARVSWRILQPVEGGPIDWSKLGGFEQELKSLKKAGITPVVVIVDSPYWATVAPSSCAAIRRDKFPAFEKFVRSVVERYKTPEFNVHNWELGNEPDVDPRTVKTDNAFGCWGVIEDKYFGGEHYGNMLKVIGPAIKSVDPTAKVWFGGLLLGNPNTTTPNRGKPEMFLKGALIAGAAPYFDILPYHWYPGYMEKVVDHDLPGAWGSYGGGTVGKAKYLRQTMAEFGVSKPIFLNESNLMCVSLSNCNPAGSDFFEMQANHIIRSYVRGLSAGVAGFSVYTLNGPGWRQTGLLDESGNPRPAFAAYKEFIKRLERARYSHKITDFGGIEAFAFISDLQEVDVAWSYDETISKIKIPQEDFLGAYTRDGNPIEPIPVGEYFEIRVGFEPVYIIRQLRR